MKILAIGSHYDDIELSAGGTMAKFKKEGNEIYAIITSLSDYTNYDGDVLRTDIDSRKEGNSGLLKLGFPFNNIYNLNYPTKKVPYNSEIIEKINRYIDEINPDLIITQHINAESHQDHLNTARSVMAAARYQNNIWMFEPLYPSKKSNIPFRAVIYVDISDTIDLKIDSLKEHKSQWIKYPYWEKMVLSVATLRGIEIKALYAEAFEPIKQEYKI